MNHASYCSPCWWAEAAGGLFLGWFSLFNRRTCAAFVCEVDGEEGAQRLRDVASKVDLIEGGAWINLVCYRFRAAGSGTASAKFNLPFVGGKAFSRLVFFLFDPRLLLFDQGLQGRGVQPLA